MIRPMTDVTSELPLYSLRQREITEYISDILFKLKKLMK